MSTNLPGFPLFPNSIKKITPASKNNSPTSQVPSFSASQLPSFDALFDKGRGKEGSWEAWKIGSWEKEEALRAGLNACGGK
jgi:hypothetical protein